MHRDEFKRTLTQENPPSRISDPLKALWIEANGDWDAAHRIVQMNHDRDSMWVHAYMHRKEGDLGNASYWYHRSDKPMSELSLAEEWDEIVQTLLGID